MLTKRLQLRMPHNFATAMNITVKKKKKKKKKDPRGQCACARHEKRIKNRLGKKKLPPIWCPVLLCTIGPFAIEQEMSHDGEALKGTEKNREMCRLQVQIEFDAVTRSKSLAERSLSYLTLPHKNLS